MVMMIEALFLVVCCAAVAEGLSGIMSDARWQCLNPGKTPCRSCSLSSTITVACLPKFFAYTTERVCSMECGSEPAIKWHCPFGSEICQPCKDATALTPADADATMEEVCTISHDSYDTCQAHTICGSPDGVVCDRENLLCISCRDQPAACLGERKRFMTFATCETSCRDEPILVGQPESVQNASATTQLPSSIIGKLQLLTEPSLESTAEEPATTTTTTARLTTTTAKATTTYAPTTTTETPIPEAPPAPTTMKPALTGLPSSLPPSGQTTEEIILPSQTAMFNMTTPEGFLSVGAGQTIEGMPTRQVIACHRRSGSCKYCGLSVGVLCPFGEIFYVPEANDDCFRGCLQDSNACI